MFDGATTIRPICKNLNVAVFVFTSMSNHLVFVSQPSHLSSHHYTSYRKTRMLSGFPYVG